MVTTSGVLSSTVAAVDADYCSDEAKKASMEQYYANQGINFYDPCSTACVAGSSGSTTLKGEHNSEKIFNWLKDNGLNSAAAAGVMGNMSAESGLNPFRFQGGVQNIDQLLADAGYGKAWGLVQWDGTRRISVLTALKEKFPNYMQYIDITYGGGADDYTKAPADVVDAFISFELEYVKYESTPGGGRSQVWEGLTSFPDTEEGALEAAIFFHDEFEGSADSADKVRNGVRGTDAKKFFNELGAGSASAAGCVSVPNGAVKYYSQHDPLWANKVYAGDTFTAAGCGPTSMAMILATLIDKNIKPTDVGAVAGVQNGQTDHGNLINGVNQAYGLAINTQALTMDEAIEFIKSGKGMVWAGGTGLAPYTQNGHMIAIVGIKDDGAQLTVADPHNPPHEQIKDYSREHMEAYTKSMYGVPKK